MTLTYRGVHYNSATVSTDRAFTNTTGKYRGVPVRFTSAQATRIPQAVMRLTYRGVDYLAVR